MDAPHENPWNHFWHSHRNHWYNSRGPANSWGNTINRASNALLHYGRTGLPYLAGAGGVISQYNRVRNSYNNHQEYLNRFRNSQTGFQQKHIKKYRNNKYYAKTSRKTFQKRKKRIYKKRY